MRTALHHPSVSVLAALLASGLSACAGTKEPTPATQPGAEEATPFSTSETTRRLTLLHTSDNESDLLGIDGENEAPRGGVSRVVTMVRALAARSEAPVLVAAAGDTMMPAPALRLDIDGANAVAAANNLIGYAVSALGNHEWDLGEAFLAEYLEDAAFPYVSASTTPTSGPLRERWAQGEDLDAPLWATDMPGKLAPRVRVCIGERKGAGTAATCDGLVVGVIGATTELLRGISNVPDHVDLAASLEDVRARVQAEADRFAAQGVDVVVLLSHLQDVRKELKLVADGLTGVDIIVAGGGDNRLADEDHRLLTGDEPDPVCGSVDGTCYPIVRRARDGRPVLIVATDGQLRYLGELNVGFDAQGVLTGVDESSRPWPVDDRSLTELGATRAEDALAFEASVTEKLAPLSEPFAKTAVYLEGAREFVRNRQTNLGDLSADSMAWAARQHKPKGVTTVAFAARNGGGIRAPIGSVGRDTYKKGGGPLRPLDIKSALRFDGPIVVMTTTHDVLFRTFEAALREVGTGRGQFPQVSGEVLLEYVQDAPDQHQKVGKDGRVQGIDCPGQHVWNLRIQPPGGEPIVVVDEGVVKTPGAKISFATLSFLAKGGDGWFPAATRKAVTKPVKHKDGEVTEQWALRNFIEAQLLADTWNDGAAYVDPTPSDAATFTRIRAVDAPVKPSSACAEK